MGYRTKTKKDDLVSKLKDPIQKIASTAGILKWSPDETKFMYVSTESATLPQIITPPLIGANSQPETREIKPGAIYVYDIKEDKNFEVMPHDKNLLAKLAPVTPAPPSKGKTIITPTPLPAEALAKAGQFVIPNSQLIIPLQWYPSSRHLILTEKDKITIMDYDGTNKAVVYAGPFVNSFVFPWSDGSRLVILTSLNQSQPDVKSNLYSINLR